MIRHIDSSKVRVLFVSDHFGHGGGVIHGATRYFLTVLPKLSSQGVALSVAFLRGYHPSVEQLKEHGVEPTFFDRAKWNPWTVVDVLRLVRRERIQVIHAAGMKGILTARIAGRIAGVPVIAHLHDYMPVPSVLSGPLRWTSEWGARTLAVSREVMSFAKETLDIDPAITEVLANGMIIEDIEKTPVSAGVAFRKHLGITEDAKVIGIIGRLISVKGHDTLLRAMPGVLAKEPKARLMIVGDGPERQAIEARTHELGLSGYVFYSGHVTDAYAAMRAVDVCAIPSLSEGLSYVMLEAMAMGKPVVASAVGGLAETLNHCENGVLVRPNDAQALTKALTAVLATPLLSETIIQGGRETVATFDITNHIDRLTTIYRALATGEAIPAVVTPVAVRPTAAVADRAAAFGLTADEPVAPDASVDVHIELTDRVSQTAGVRGKQATPSSSSDVSI